MSLHADLREQAEHLATREKKRPKQASLRRAVSSAYYSLFHLLIKEASTMLVSNDPLRNRVARTFIHSEMNKASKSFGGGNLPKRFDPMTGGAAVPAALMSVANAFVELQQARHEADYNLAKRFTRNEVNKLLAQAAQAFKDWQAIRRDDYARLYLVCLLLWERFDRIQ